MTKYRVDVERGKKFWLVHVPAIDRWTQARRISEIPEMASDLIEAMTDEPSETIELDVRIALPDEVRTHLTRSQELREEAARAQTSAAREFRAAARALHETEMSMREIGEVLGVSYQRAHQLVSQQETA